MYRIVYSNELRHHGIKGQKWGVRRFQNPDGTLTEAGSKRYGEQYKNTKLAWRDYRREKTEERLKIRDAHPEYSRSEESRRAINNLGKKYGHLRIRELRKSHWIKVGVAALAAHTALNVAVGAINQHDARKFFEE